MIKFPARFCINFEDWKLVQGLFITILKSKYDGICLYLVVDLVVTLGKE